MRAKGFRLHRSAYIRLLVLTVLAMLIFYLMGVYLNHMGTVNVERSVKEMARAKLQYASQETDRSLTNLVMHAQEIGADEELLRFALTGDLMSDYQRTVAIRDLSDELFRMRRMSPLVDAAKILLPGTDKVITAEQTIYDDMQPGDYVLLDAARALPQATCIVDDDALHLVFRRELGAQDIAVCVSVRHEALLWRMWEMLDAENACVILLSDDGARITSTNADMPVCPGTADGPQFMRVNGVDYVYAEMPLEAADLRVQFCRPVDSVMYGFIRHGGWLWVLTAMSLVMLVAYITYFRKAIYHPLSTIYQAMEQMEKPGDFEISESSNEFDDIYTRFRYMINRLERLASEVYEERYRAKQAELMQLQTQINPHFFYNTLFLIYRMAKDEGCDDIAELSGHLSRFYRYITKSPGQTVALREEIEHISNYLEIQRIRFQPRISIEVQPLPEAIAGERVPSLVIQPLVENAFVHGVQDAAWKACVSVRYEYEDTWFRVIVADNGGNMTEEKAEALRRRLDNNEMHEGSALANLKRRMELRYGGDYTLELKCVDEGLTAIVTFPRGKEGSGNDVTADRG